MSQPFKTDALQPQSLPSARIGQRPRPSSIFLSDAGQASVLPGERQKAELDAVHEEWNVRIDKEVKAVTTSLSDIIDLANTNPNTAVHDPTIQTLQLKLRTANLIKATQNIRDMTHELKMIMLLSDTVGLTRKRDAEAWAVRRDVEGKRADVGEEVVRLLGERGRGLAAAPVASEADQRAATGLAEGQSPTKAEGSASPEPPLPPPQGLTVPPVPHINRAGLDNGNGDDDDDDDDDDMEEV